MYYCSARSPAHSASHAALTIAAVVAVGVAAVGVAAVVAAGAGVAAGAAVAVVRTPTAVDAAAAAVRTCFFRAAYFCTLFSHFIHAFHPADPCCGTTCCNIW